MNIKEKNWVELDCDVEGEPKPTNFTWYSSTHLISHFPSQSDHQYNNITELTAFDEGKYVCQATTEAGTAEKTFVLKLVQQDEPSE